MRTASRVSCCACMHIVLHTHTTDMRTASRVSCCACTFAWRLTMCTMWACMLPLQGWDDVDVAPTAEELAKEQHHAQVFAAFQDDKEPLAENVPNPTADALLSNSAGVEPTKAKPVWADAHGMPPTCPRASNDHNCAGTGKLKNYPTDPLYQDVDGNPTRAGLFLHFCPLHAGCRHGHRGRTAGEET